MNTDRELMQLALEALRFALHVGFDESSESQIKKGDKAVRQHENVIAALRERLAQPEQEPFCFHDGRNIVGKEYSNHSDVFPLFTSPPPRQWQGLTDEDLFDIASVNFGEPDLQLFIEMGKLVQKELKEKNA